MNMNGGQQIPLFVDEPHLDPPDPDDEVSLIALSQVQGVGFSTVRALFNAFEGHLSAVWQANPTRLHDVLYRARTPRAKEVAQLILERTAADLSHAQEHLRFLKTRRQVSIVFRTSDAYPRSLRDLRDPPSWLFVQGEPHVLHDPSVIAVVGTRTPTDSGLEAARRLSIVLCRHRYIVLSGLAEGIDAVGHQVAVDYAVPTIAVLGHGIDVVFPAATSALRQRIVAQGGAVISEYLPGDMYTKERFVQRNRLQAALSRVVAVVEGQTRSGTAHTVRFARQLHRDVFGVRLGELQPSEAQHTLLVEIGASGAPIFDMATREGTKELVTYLLDKQLPGSHKGMLASRAVFRSVLLDVRRVAESYGASQEDFAWLIEQLRKLARTEGQENAD